MFVFSRFGAIIMQFAAQRRNAPRFFVHFLSFFSLPCVCFVLSRACLGQSLLGFHVIFCRQRGRHKGCAQAGDGRVEDKTRLLHNRRCRPAATAAGARAGAADEYDVLRVGRSGRADGSGSRNGDGAGRRSLVFEFSGVFVPSLSWQMHRPPSEHLHSNKVGRSVSAGGCT